MAATDSFELGQTITLTATFDLDDALIDASSVVCTITLPDGTTATPAVTRTSQGTYAASYLTAQYGTHTVRWTATVDGDSTPKTTYFFVGDPATLDELKDSLNDRTGSSLNDSELTRFLTSALGIIEGLVGPIVPKAFLREQRDGGSPTIITRWTPIISVQSLTEYAGRTAFAYTAITDPSQASNYTYLVDPSLNGVIHRLGPSGYPQPFCGPVYLSYTAGRAVLSERLHQAVVLQATEDYQRSQVGNRSAVANQQAAERPLISPIVAELIKPDLLVGGVA